MKLRTLVVTIIVLALLSAGVALMRQRPAATARDAKVGQPLVERGTAEKAARLRVSDQGKSVLLTRQEDGSWRVSSYFDLPADFQKLSRFVDDLSEARLQRLVTSQPQRISRLEFKDTQIAFLDAADKELWSVTLGKSADTGGRFVRFGSEQKAYLANLNAWIDAESKNWAQSQLLSVKPEDVAKLELALPATAGTAETQTVVLTRTAKDQSWAAEQTPVGQRLKADRVSTLLSSLTGLRFTDTAEPADGTVTEAKRHLRTHKLTTFDGRTYTLAIGRKPEEKKLKAPTAAADKSGPGALGSIADLGKKKEPETTPGEAGAGPAPEPAKPLTPEFETIPAGPAFAFITSSDAAAPINAAMQKRAFEVAEYAIGQLPQTAAELFEPVPPPAAPATAPAAGK